MQRSLVEEAFLVFFPIKGVFCQCKGKGLRRELEEKARHKTKRLGGKPSLFACLIQAFKGMGEIFTFKQRGIYVCL
jgi:hypothetical protein